MARTDSRTWENPRWEAMARRTGVVRETGELMHVDMLPGFEDEQLAKRPPVGYSWRGRHMNVSKEMGAAVWRKDSGYDRNDRDVLGFYLFNSGERAARVEMTFDQIGQELGMNPRAVSKSVKKLHAGGFLLEAGTMAKVTLYRLNGRFGYDGPAEEQVKAVADMRHPVIPAPEPEPAKSRPSKEVK
ncbi:transcriptional regulator [Streptomyces sp. NPDC059679]|uniref:transcriptional regulator n=1 Tax=Streptomyces sp. NPDC059679 TaxID=3346903 RepID=UPI00367A605D